MHNPIDLNAVLLDEDYQALLLDYASGALGGGMALMMAAYVAVCPEARRMAAHFETLGGLLMEKDCAPVAMADRSLYDVLDQLETVEARCASAAPCGEEGDCFEPVRKHFEALGIPAPKWRKVWPGMTVAKIAPQPSADRVTVMRLSPAAAPPAHRHETMEMTLVLGGALSDGEAAYKAGDLFVRQAGTAHQPKACPEQGCTCMVMSAEPVRFTNLLAKMLYRFMT